MALASVGGGGGGGSAFNGGTITSPLVIDTSSNGGNEVPLTVIASYGDHFASRRDFVAVINSDPGGGQMLHFDPALTLSVGDETDSLGVNGEVRSLDATPSRSARLVGSDVEADGLIQAATSGAAGTYLSSFTGTALWKRIDSGALPTTTFVSGTGKQIDATTDRMLVVPCTLNPTAGAAGTVAVALSPDGSTYSTLATITEPAGVALDGTIQLAQVMVPRGWYVKLTATNAVIGTGTYY